MNVQKGRGRKEKKGKNPRREKQREKSGQFANCAPQVTSAKGEGGGKGEGRMVSGAFPAQRGPLVEWLPGIEERGKKKGKKKKKKRKERKK